MEASSSLLRMEQIQGKGRGLVAAQPLKAGQIVLTESPLMLYSAFPLISQRSSSTFSYCDHCFRILQPSSASVVSCPSCSGHHFCSQRCLSLALKSSHSPWVCQTLSCLKNNASEFLRQPPERQIQARCVVAAYNLSPSDFHILLSLLGTPDDSIFSAAKFIHSLISSVYPPQNQPSVELTAQFLAKDRINSFCLMDPYSPDGPQRSIRAYAIYPVATLINHDCLPNACWFDYVDNIDPGDQHNCDIVIRMIQDVPAGTEVCLSYFRINKDYETRKKILREDYEFVCNCERCKIEANKEEDGDFSHAYFLLKYVCDRKNCSGTMAPLPPKNDCASNVLECNFCGNLKTAVE